MRDLYFKRFIAAQKVNAKYMRLLLNDHFVVFLLIAFGAAVLGYRALLTQSQFHWLWSSPYLLVGVMLWLLLGLQMGTMVTYFESADCLYLLGNDSDLLKYYLRDATVVSMLFATIWQVLFFIVVMPILGQVNRLESLRVILLAIFLLTYKLAILLFARQQLLMQKKHPFQLIYKMIFRVIIPVIVLETCIMAPVQYALLVILIWLTLWVGILRQTRISQETQNTKAINWISSISQSTKHQQRVFHFYATFADVPQKQHFIKRRLYLDWVINLLTKRQDIMYRLYLIRLMRDTTILPLLSRLALVGMILIAGLNTAPVWLNIVMSIGTLYLVTFQLMPLYESTKDIMWTRLLPITGIQSKQSFKLLHRQVTSLVSVLLVVASFSNGGVVTLMTVLGTIIAGMLLNGIYVPKRIKQL